MQAPSLQPHPAPSLPSTDTVISAAAPRQMHHQQGSDAALAEGSEACLQHGTPEDSSTASLTNMTEDGTQQQSSRPQSGAFVAEGAPEQQGQPASPDTVMSDAGEVDPEPQRCQPFVDSGVPGSCFPQQAQLPCQQSGMPCGLGQLPTAQGELPFEQAGVPSEHRLLPTEQLCTNTQAAGAGNTSSNAAQHAMHPRRELPSRSSFDNQLSDLQDSGGTFDPPAEHNTALGKAASDQDGLKGGARHEGEGASGCLPECAADNDKRNAGDSTVTGRAGLCPVGITTYTQVRLTLLTEPGGLYRVSPQRGNPPLQQEQTEKVSGFNYTHHGLLYKTQLTVLRLHVSMNKSFVQTK